jgi:uncharacterized protein
MMVLDAWAVMAWLKGQQPAAGRVRLLLEAAERREQKLLINIVNLGEVFYVSVKARDLAYGERVIEALRPRLTVIPATESLVMTAATLKSRHAISYADAFAAATAILRNAPLVTGDPELQTMAQTEKNLKLEWLAGQ